MPLAVSVVVTTYNQAAYLPATLRSVLEQTLRPYEIVVVDDGSTDGTSEAIKPFLAQIRYIRQNNAGVAESRNTGVAAARGELIALLDGDDLWHPEKLEAQVQAYRAHSHAGLIIVDVDQFGSTGVIWPSVLTALRKEIADVDHQAACASRYQDLLQGNWIATTSSVMVPAKVLADVGRSDPDFAVASDYDLYLRIAERYDVVLVRRVLAYWRYLASSASGAADQRSWRWGLDVVRVLAKRARRARGSARVDLVAARNRAARRTARGAYVREDRTGRWRTFQQLAALNAVSPTIAGIGYSVLTLVPTPIRSAAGLVKRSLRRGASTARPA